MCFVMRDKSQTRNRNTGGDVSVVLCAFNYSLTVDSADRSLLAERRGSCSRAAGSAAGNQAITLRANHLGFRLRDPVEIVGVEPTSSSSQNWRHTVRRYLDGGAFGLFQHTAVSSIRLHKRKGRIGKSLYFL